MLRSRKRIRSDKPLKRSNIFFSSRKTRTFALNFRKIREKNNVSMGCCSKLAGKPPGLTTTRDKPAHLTHVLQHIPFIDPNHNT